MTSVATLATSLEREAKYDAHSLSERCISRFFVSAQYTVPKSVKLSSRTRFTIIEMM